MTVSPSAEPAADRFLADGFDLRLHLQEYLGLDSQTLEQRLPHSRQALAALHPGGFDEASPERFYEDAVGTSHLLELADWHLGSCDYIADTIRVIEQAATGQVLDFGGGIGTHALAALAMEAVDQVWVVDLNPHNRAFVAERARRLGVSSRLHCCRDLDDPALPARFDTLICLDVLEHLSDPAGQLEIFAERLTGTGVAALNWYFFKGFSGEYPFHYDDPELVERFFQTLQSRYLEVFHPYLITTRLYRRQR
ncbi:class I SAM-dependent methyltransferase [Synechococcus sp. RSCCF101]|uniref:class I SAM-dependent methyltransferase n=1 Tax=Synechococcus sp. RSCCF101 TaxID=2511069 RepID=UPI001245E964|nr:class I SAM-dependent methyltransferase [Synechococcus sp. RSCCF101]QEY33165.1 class I SAM-dependent methyltransferase [Synechococcus sp. RSCCF101]